MAKYSIKPISSRLIKKSDSKQSVRGFNWNAFSSTILPDYSFETVNELVDADPVATGAIQHFVDKATEGDYSIIKKDSYVYDRSVEESLRYEYGWNTKILRRIYKVGKLYKNVYLEIVRDETGITPKSYNVLDSLNIDVITKPNGDVLKYKTKLANPSTGEYGEWPEKDIVWFRFDSVDNGFAPVDIKSLYTVLMQKHYIQRFVSWTWQTGQYRVIHNFKSTNDTVIQDFIAYNAKSDNDFTKPFLAGGDYVHGLLRDMKEIESLEQYLKYLDNQIVILLRIPPIDVGIPETSGRSNADAQGNNLNTHVRSFKLVVADGMNELFTKTGRGNSIWIYAPVDKFEVKLILENVRIMKSISMTDKAVREYMLDNGIVFETKMLFDKPVEAPSTDPEAAPSRERKGEGAANAKIGTGTQGTTKDSQLVKKAYDYDIAEQWRFY